MSPTAALHLQMADTDNALGLYCVNLNVLANKESNVFSQFMPEFKSRRDVIKECGNFISVLLLQLKDKQREVRFEDLMAAGPKAANEPGLNISDLIFIFE